MIKAEFDYSEFTSYSGEYGSIRAIYSDGAVLFVLADIVEMFQLENENKAAKRIIDEIVYFLDCNDNEIITVNLSSVLKLTKFSGRPDKEKIIIWIIETIIEPYLQEERKALEEWN